MDEDAEAARVTGSASLQLIIGLATLLKAKGIISAEELEMIFDSAMVGAEQAPASDLADRVRQLLERVASQIAAVPSLPTGPESPPQDNDPDQP